jgi:uncharacterized beta-barrel protein YwiB (DUF1934 family)
MINDQDETMFRALGTFDKNKLSFIDHEKQKNSILLKENSVEYIKTGDRFMHYTFDQRTITKGIYRMDQFEFNFQIITTYMDISHELLKIKFTLQQDDEIVGHHQLTIVYKDDEED